MRKLRLALIFVVVVMLVLTAVSCKKKPTEPGDTEDYAVVNDNVVDTSTMNNLSEPVVDGDTYSYTYTGTAPSIQVGDVLVGQTGYGYMRKVTGVQTLNNQIVCQTEDACIEDVISEGYFKGSAQLTMPGSEKTDGIELEPVFLDEGVTYSKGRGIQITSKVLLATGQCNLRIKNSSINFEPNVTFEHDISSLFNINYIDVSATGELTENLCVEASWSAGFQLPETIANTPVAYFMSPMPVFMIGPVPVYAGMQIDAVYKINVSSRSPVTEWNANGSQRVTCGIRYENGRATPNFDFGFSSSITSTETSDFSSPAECIQVGLLPRAILMVGGAVGPKLGPQVYLKHKNTEQNDEMVSELFLGGSLKMSLALQVWAFELASVSFDILANEIPLSVAQTVYNPAPGNYSNPQMVTISCPTAGAEIRYTTDGSTPTPLSKIYTSPLPISSDTTIKSKAFKLLMVPSSTHTGSYDIDPPPNTVAAPTFNPPGGTYTSAQNVTISCATPGVTIYYSTDGSTPSIRYTKPINISSTTTLKAKATKSGWTDSQIASAVYTINQPQTVATPTFSPPGGTYISAQSVRITCATSGATIRYTTNGSEPTTNSPTYSSPINVSSTTTIKAKGFKNGWTPSSTASATYTINAVPPGQMIFVPGGTFTMGDTRGQGYSDELPTHTVTLNSFYIGKYEVTQAEYSQYMPSPNWTSSYGLGDNYPAYRVSWYAILKYCNLRSMAEGLTPCYSISGSTNPADWGEVPTTSNSTWNAVICNWNASGYRLPTEAEWEYAARGATNNPDYLYSGSDDINAVAWYTNNSGSSTHPVGTKAPNGIGTYDMSGNVWEWCWDWYSSSYYSSSPQDNPTGPASGSFRVIRGGSWISNAYYCTVSNRDDNDAASAGNVVGFRICRVFP
jgi:sulfatase modifying factor 1